MKQDLTGRRFGKLTVISRNPQLEDRYYTWNCQCDCGGQIIVNTKRLTRGTVTNCGCIPKMNRKHGSIPADYTGDVFGSLTVLKRAENKGQRAAWLCKCDCGNEVIVATHDLRTGHTKSCGCISHENPFYRDLTGQRIGFLSVMMKTDKRDYKGSVLWQCHCDCGNDVLYSADSLLHGGVKSCGCYRENEICGKINDTLHRVDGTCIELLEKRKHRSDNTSGFRGVTIVGDRYRAHIGLQGKRYNLGTYDTFEEAVESRLHIENALHNGFAETWKRYTDNGTDPNAATTFFYNVTKTDNVFLIETPYGTETVRI